MSLPSSAPERAIQNSSEDRLERSAFIERLASALIDPATKKSTGIVVGITGPWGSGKSSILNLLLERIRSHYSDALIVRFDPWLVSGRNDLIAEFLGELIGTINADEKRFRKFKGLGKSFAQYGAQLAPVGNLWVPGLGAAVSGGLNALEKAFSKKDSLNALRQKLIKELETISAPIVVLVDEIDRVEDDEIRSVAQLVRSVVDFPSISYVLAYDSERVIQALGAGAAADRQVERGRSYLEKIVQFQIPLPIIFDDEISRLLTADIAALNSELRLPGKFEDIPRYHELVTFIAGTVITTLRDVRRLVGTFHVLAGMLREEVDWIDLLAYSALLIKAPQTVANMRRDPEDFIENPMSVRGIARYLARKRESSTLDEILNKLMHPAENNNGTKVLLQFLFPWLSDEGQKETHPDALRERRPLMTVLRLGLLPGAFSRNEITSLVAASPTEIKMKLQHAYEKDVLGGLIDRIDDLYLDIGAFNRVSFWTGVGEFVKKADCEWFRSYQPMHEAIRSLTSILERSVRKSESERKLALEVFKSLHDAGEVELTAYWLRHHLFLWGLFGQEARGRDSWFLDAKQTATFARSMAESWRSVHLSGKLIPCRWDLQPVYTMIDVGVWDVECMNWINKAISEDRALDGFTLMLFGGPFTTDKATLAKMCDYDLFLDRVQSRLKGADELDESVRVALRKATGEQW